MGTIADLPALYLLHERGELRAVGMHPRLDGRFAGHRLQQVVARALRVGAAEHQIRRQLLHRCRDVTDVEIGRHLAHEHRPVTEVLAGKAVLRENVEVLEHRRILLRRQRHRRRSQQRLAHDRLGVLLQAVEAHALVRGVLVDEPDVLLLILTDNIGVEHLPGDAPRSLLRLQHLLRRLLGEGHRRLRRLLSLLHRLRCGADSKSQHLNPESV